MEHEPIVEMGSARILPGYMYCKPFMVNEGTGAGVCRQGWRRCHSFILGLPTTIFQADIYAIKACIMENTEKGCTGSNMCILANSQAAFNACEAEHNRIELVWVLGHVGIDGSETADQLAMQVSAISLTWPEPSLGISAKVVRGLIRD